MSQGSLPDPDAPVTVAEITGPLPAGTNNIGDVDVVSSALPTGAATEATLASVDGALDVPLSTRASETTLGTRASEATLGTRASEATLSTRAADRPLATSPHATRLSDGTAFYKATTPADTQPTSSAAASQVDGHSASIGATGDADTANTVIGRLKQLLTRLPAALIGGRLDINIGSWLGSTAPTVGAKTIANSIPVTVASDQILPVSSGATEEATFTVVALVAVLGNNKSLLSIYNPVDSSVVLKLREYYVRNAQTTAVTGVIAQLQILRFAMALAPTGGTALTPAQHDTTQSVGAGVDARTGGAITGEIAQPLDTMRISSDEWGPGTLDQEGSQQTISNYLPARVKRDPQQKALAILRAGQGTHLKCTTNTTAGAFDIIFVFTQIPV